MPSIDEAKAFYKELTEKFEVNSYMGITYNLESAHLIPPARWKTFLDDHEPIKESDGRELIQVPSPWHACIVLFHAMAMWENNNLGDEVRRTAATALEIPFAKFPSVKSLFRGQRCSDWKVNSSLSRLSESKGKEELQAINAGKRFSALLRHALKLSGFPFIDDHALLAAAQHYQIPTNFIDFSLDPAIAVFFANEDKPGAPCISRASRGSVFAISANKLLANGSLRTALPPPMFHRVYIQCGVFAEFTGELATDCRPECMEVRFERNDDFEVLRAGKPVNDILRPNSFVQSLSEDCRKWAEVGQDWDSSKSAGGSSFIDKEFANLDATEFKSFQQSLRTGAIGDWMLESSRTFEGVSVGCVDGRYDINPSGVENLVDYNPVFSTLLASHYYGLAAGLTIAIAEAPSQLKRDQIKRYLNLVNNLAQEISNSLSKWPERINKNNKQN